MPQVKAKLPLASTLSNPSNTTKQLDRMEIAHPETTRIGWIGTGVMGRSMCSHLLKAGYKTSVFNRSVEKLNDLVHLGAGLVLAHARSRRKVTSSFPWWATLPMWRRFC